MSTKNFEKELKKIDDDLAGKNNLAKAKKFFRQLIDIMYENDIFTIDANVDGITVGLFWDYGVEEFHMTAKELNNRRDRHSKRIQRVAGKGHSR